jgi:hypothetical protein
MSSRKKTLEQQPSKIIAMASAGTQAGFFCDSGPGSADAFDVGGGLAMSAAGAPAKIWAVDAMSIGGVERNLS